MACRHLPSIMRRVPSSTPHPLHSHRWVKCGGVFPNSDVAIYVPYARFRILWSPIMGPYRVYFIYKSGDCVRIIAQHPPKGSPESLKGTSTRRGYRGVCCFVVASLLLFRHAASQPPREMEWRRRRPRTNARLARKAREGRQGRAHAKSSVRRSLSHHQRNAAQRSATQHRNELN